MGEILGRNPNIPGHRIETVVKAVRGKVELLERITR